MNAETCDDVDNDCNGIVDDNLTDATLNDACCPHGAGNCEVGSSCASDDGTIQCDASGNLACEGGDSRVSNDTCSTANFDDDCDGSVDEDTAASTDVNHCGSCGRDCAALDTPDRHVQVYSCRWLLSG